MTERQEKLIESLIYEIQQLRSELSSQRKARHDLPKYLTATEALTALGLYVPGHHKVPKKDYITSLVKRGLLKRISLGPRKFVYKKEDCEKLLERCRYDGISLTAKY